jgi:hypothetical protein
MTSIRYLLQEQDHKDYKATAWICYHVNNELVIMVGDIRLLRDWELFLLKRSFLLCYIDDFA